MGKGVALEFRKRFPDMYDDYVRRCGHHQVRLGQPYLYRRLFTPWILNFPTKDHWRSVSKLGDIVQGLEYLESKYRDWGITSLAVPPLGCGQGQLEWSVVGPTLYRHLMRLDIAVELYAPYGTAEYELETTFLAGPTGSQGANGASVAIGERRVQPAMMSLVEVLERIEREPYHWPVGRTTFQKIAYFATESGIPTGLRYGRGSFGPFAADLKGLTTRLVNNGLIREDRRGRMFAVHTGPTYRDAKEAYGDEMAKWEPIVERLADLFVRMNTNQSEIAATVHFAAQALSSRSGRKPTEREVLSEVMDWKQRRRPPIDEGEVADAIRHLAMLGWIHVTASPDLPLHDHYLAEV
jgi:uncharacterized protein YwgA